MSLLSALDPLLINQLSERLYPEPPSGGAYAHGDHVLANVPPSFRSITPAAVLVPIVPREGERGPYYAMMLTQRAPLMRQHAAQIAFPGGKIDPADATPLAAALREAHEEIDLPTSLVRPLGYLDHYLSATGYGIVPIVGMVDPSFSPHPNPNEVEDVFEVPLDFLMDANNHERHAREWQGILRHYYAMPYGKRYIWGATAGIIRNLYEKLYAP